MHHDEYQDRADAQLVEYLRHLRMWSRFEARHDVITISLDLKAQARNRRQFPRWLDATIEEFLGRDRLFTPAELMGSASSLVAGAMASGWPTLEELRGHFILVLSGDEPTKASYAGSGRNRLCFADQRLGDGDARLSLTEDRVFFNLNATEDWDWHGALRWFARQPGFITRAYVANSVDLWSRLLAADANICRPTRCVTTHGHASVTGRSSISARHPIRRPDDVADSGGGGSARSVVEQASATTSSPVGSVGASVPRDPGPGRSTPPGDRRGLRPLAVGVRVRRRSALNDARPVRRSRR